MIRLSSASTTTPYDYILRRHSSLEQVGVGGLLGFLATFTSGLGELSDGACNLTHAVPEVGEVVLAFIRVGVVLLAHVCVFGEENFSNLVHSLSESEELGLEIEDHVIHGAVVGLVEAETGNFEGELVEAAGLLHVKTDLVEFSNRFEDLNEVTREKESVEVCEVLIG